MWKPGPGPGPGRPGPPGLLLLLLLCGLLASCDPGTGTQTGARTETEPLEPQREPENRLDFGDVPAGVYETLAHYEPGPIGILIHLVHTFLCAVQPNAFPQGRVGGGGGE